MSVLDTIIRIVGGFCIGYVLRDLQEWLKIRSKSKSTPDN